jgi:hypothetical protein
MSNARNEIIASIEDGAREPAHDRRSQSPEAAELTPEFEDAGRTRQHRLLRSLDKDAVRNHVLARESATRRGARSTKAFTIERGESKPQPRGILGEQDANRLVTEPAGAIVEDVGQAVWMSRWNPARIERIEMQ